MQLVNKYWIEIIAFFRIRILVLHNYVTLVQSIQSSILEQMILFNQLVTSICLNFFFFSNKEYKFERFFGEIESYSKWNCFKNLILRMYYFFPVSMHFSFYRIIILLDLMIYLTEYWELNQGLRELRSFFFLFFILVGEIANFDT